MGPEAEKNLLSVWVSWWARRDFWCCDTEVRWVLCPQSQHHTWIFLVQTVSAEGRRKHWSLCVSIVWAGRVHTLSWQRWSHSRSTGAGCHGQGNQWKVATDTRSDLEESNRHGTPVWTREISRQSASPDSHSSVSLVTVQYILVKIMLKDDAEPYSISIMRRIPLPLMCKVEHKVECILLDGMIKNVTQPTLCVPMVLVLKKNGDVRICIDLKHLNQSVKCKCYMLPTLEDMMHKLAGSKVFLKVDATSGFWQISRWGNGEIDHIDDALWQISIPDFLLAFHWRQKYFRGWWRTFSKAW